MGQSSRKQLCWYNPQAWYRKLLFITVHLLVVIQICKMFGSFRFFHAITPNVGWTFFSLCFLFPSLLVYGSICPQRGKNQGKSDKIFFYISILFGTDDKKMTCRVFCFTYARTCAPSNSDVDFLLSQVSHKGKFGGKNRANFGGRKKEKNDFWSSFQPIFSLWNSCLLKYVWKYVVIDWIIVCCLLFCDTCDSKNAKTPGMRVYACAREKGVIDVFTIRMQCSRFLFRG